LKLFLWLMCAASSIVGMLGVEWLGSYYMSDATRSTFTTSNVVVCVVFLALSFILFLTKHFLFAYLALALMLLTAIGIGAMLSK
jgi:hypothetical protein